MDVPNCKCHGYPMRWHRDSRLPPGGWWRCSEKLSEYGSTYNNSTKGYLRSLRHEVGRQAARVQIGLASVEDELRRIEEELKAAGVSAAAIQRLNEALK
jgi:hypothetical protein